MPAREHDAADPGGNRFDREQPISVAAPRVMQDGSGASELKFQITLGGRQEGFAVRSSSAAPPSPLLTEASVAAALLPAMKLGVPLRVESEIDAALLAQLPTYQDILCQWYPEFHRVKIEPVGISDHPATPRGEGVGAFFSGGVDSFYTLLKHRDEITHAIFVHGVDIEFENDTHRDLVAARLRSACESLGVELIEIDTDLRTFSDPYADWGRHYHGAGLVTIAMSLAGLLGKVYIAASETYATMEPWGSTLITDPLWSTPALEVINDGGERYRHEKVAACADDPAFLEHLRVCWENEDGELNCGRCEKCYRTMVALRLAGALGHCSAFARPLDLEEMVESELLYRDPHTAQFWGEMQRVSAVINDTGLAAALDEVVRRCAYVGQVKEFARNNRDVLASPQWKRLLPKIRNKLIGSIREHDPKWFADRLAELVPEERERAFESLWRHDNRWLRKRTRAAARARLGAKLKRLFRGKT